MKRGFQYAALGILLLVVASLGCGKGIETGNPSIQGYAYLIKPESGTHDYHVFIVDKESTLVSQVKKEESNGIPVVLDESLAAEETVTVQYTLVKGVLSLEASFSDGIQLKLRLEFNAEEQLVSGRIEINGEQVEGELTQSTNGEPIQISESPVPEPTLTPDEPSLEDISGTYTQSLNTCESNSSPLTIEQEGTLLQFTGAFDYQQNSSPDSFSGSFDPDSFTGNSISFTIDENNIRWVTCSASLEEGLLDGQCTVIRPSPGFCEFLYVFTE